MSAFNEEQIRTDIKKMVEFALEEMLRKLLPNMKN